MKSNNAININQDSSCHCGSTLQLDVLSLNRKLFGAHSNKSYCMPCMAELFECAVEDVVTKLKRDGIGVVIRHRTKKVLRGQSAFDTF